MLKTIKNLFKKKETADSMRNNPEPWVNVIKAQIDPENPKQGYFELEWNPAFVLFLKRNGYKGPTPEEIVDSWFTDLCRNIGADGDAADSIIADGERIRTNDRTRNQSDI